jgi:acyl dehydratase
MTLLTPELEAIVGRSAEYTAPEPFGAAAARYFATAIGDTNPLYRDADYARSLGLRDVAIPPTLVAETTQFTGLEPGPEGSSGHDWGLEVPGTRRVRGGNHYRFYRRIQADDIVTVRYTLTRIDPKTTRAGAQMLVFVTEMRVTDQRGALLLENEETDIMIEIQSLTGSAGAR